MRLPSGRQLSYYKPRIITNRFGNDAVSYEGLNQETKKWERTDTFGGKLVENLVQATARDCMMEKFSRLSAMGFKIVMRVHDELVVEIDKEDCENTLHKINKIMSEPIIWATGLPLAAAGFTSEYYKKD
jgi:DNA polymerase